MQKVKKAAARLDRFSAISVLENLNNNQIAVYNYDKFCTLYEAAINCETQYIAPLFREGTFIVKREFEDVCVYLLMNFTTSFGEDNSIIAELESLKINFPTMTNLDEDYILDVELQAIKNGAKNYEYIGKIKVEYFKSARRLISFSNSVVEILEQRGHKNIMEYLGGMPEALKNIDSSVNLFFGLLVCVDYLLKHPEEKKKETSEKHHTTSKNITRRIDDVQIISLNSLKFKTSDMKKAKILRSKTIYRIAENWAVRGHYRHYKNGKTIFIEGYEKGKKRQEKLQRKTKYEI